MDKVDAKGAVGRSTGDAPEIDGLVYMEDGRGLQPGEYAAVTIRRATEHDLYAVRAIDACDRGCAWAAALTREVIALWFASRDPRTPLAAKVLALLVVAYALSPIDLIPDFIPVLGYLDEVVLLPGAIYLILKLIPAQVTDGLARERSRLGSRKVGTAEQATPAAAGDSCLSG